MNELIPKLNSSATAKKKTSIAKIYLKQNLSLNKSKIIINDNSLKNLFNINYFDTFLNYINIITKNNLIYDLKIIVKGGGIQSQRNAIRLGILKSFINLNIEYKSLFKKYNLIDNDSRIKERRKYGLKKARKASQYSKR